MADLNVTAYQTANTINVKEGSLFPGAKDKITLNDLYEADTTYSEKLKTEFKTWKLQNPSETTSDEDYRTAALNSGAFEYEGIRAGQEKKEFWFNLIATGVVVGLAIVCPPAGLAAGVIYTTIDAAGAIKGEDLISGRKLSDEERLMRGAFAIVPGAGGLAAKSLLKHMPALGTVMKTVSKTMDDAVKPIKTKVDHLTITGKQTLKTTVAKTQQQALKATDSVRLVKQNLTLTGKQALKTTHKKVSQATNSIKSTKQSIESSINKTVEHAKKLGKAHADQLRFALSHPVIATLTSKAGQKSIRGTASIIDAVKRPVYIKSMEVIGGPKIPVGIERGPSEDVFKNKAEDLISRMQAEKDAIRGTVGKNPEIVKFTEEQLATKPPYSRGPVKWQKKGGEIEIDEEGTWTYIDWIFLQIEFLILGFSGF
ncbi:pre-toxin TG domain-containing protein [uncultured Rummeliibacillus sp.]|uniref:pre-toxin TG domain-containing protein n=1 Tax=uncultured Rummeliibacillus sp. TaxID=762292 RepID=UPI00260B30D4|nr:pre-toxin TG domain-containing protein [uncultured Rummeliibacillus sp.]